MNKLSDPSRARELLEKGEIGWPDNSQQRPPPPIPQHRHSHHHPHPPHNHHPRPPHLCPPHPNPQPPHPNPQPPTTNPQLPTSNPQAPTSNPQTPTSNPQPPTSNPQPPTSNPQPPTSNPQPPNPNPQPPNPHPEPQPSDSDSKPPPSNSQSHASQVAKDVFCPDDRYIIDSTNVFPYSAIAYIDTGCTGTFIGPRHVLTAASCIYNSERRRWKENIRIYRGKGCAPNNGVIYTFKTALIMKEYRNLQLETHDLALILVNDSSPVYMEIGYLNPMPKMALTVKGYPDDNNDLCLSGSWCNLAWESRYQLGHSCDTYYGMKGSAVYTRNWDTKEYVIYCVHTTGGSATEKYNRCVRITEERYALIKNWMKL